VWDATTFTKNRERLQHGDLFNRFMETLLHHTEVTPLLSDEHFSVDGTRIDAWAGHKSFKPKNETDRDGEHFHGTRRRQPPVPQERGQGEYPPLHGTCHNGKLERPRRGGAGHAGVREAERTALEEILAQNASPHTRITVSWNNQSISERRRIIRNAFHYGLFVIH
jgi:hypothetical protein